MSDTIAIMRDGRIIQIGTPRALYDRPVCRYVADFVGETNFFQGEVVAADAVGASIRTAVGLTLSAPYAPGGSTLQRQGHGVIAVRPEAIRLWPGAAAPDGETLDCIVRGTVHNRIYLGDQTEFSIATREFGNILVRTARHSATAVDGPGPGEAVTLGWRREHGLALADT